MIESCIMLTMVKSKIFQASIREHDWAIRTLKTYVSIPSISAQKRSIPETIRFLIRILKSCGLRVRILRVGGNPFVYAERIVSPRAKTILFYNHYDVQPADPIKEWTSPPFKPTIRGGRLYARGVCDNKGNLITRLSAIRVFKRLGYDLPCNVKFIIDGEEESGSPSIGNLVNSYQGLLKADLCIWESGGRSADGHHKITLGHKGILGLELNVQGPKEDMHSSQGIIVPNPAWRLVWALGHLKNELEQILIDRFYAGIKKPNRLEKSVAQRYPLEEKEKLRRLGLKQFVLDLNGSQLKERYFYQPALNINGLTSGYQGPGGKTVLPARASAKLDFRLLPGQKAKDVIKKLRRYLDRKGFKDIKISSAGGYEAVQTPVNHPYVKLVTRAVEEAYKRKAFIEPISPASSPMAFFSGFVPCMSVGIGHPGAKIHAPNENIYLKDLLMGSKCIANILMALERK